MMEALLPPPSESVQVSCRKIPPRPVKRLAFLMRKTLKQTDTTNPICKNIELNPSIHECNLLTIITINSTSHDENYDAQIASPLACSKNNFLKPKGPGRLMERFKPSLNSKGTKAHESQENLRNTSSKEHTSNSRRLAKEFIDLSPVVAEQRMEHSTPRSSWREEKRNEELQARFLAGIPSPLDPSFNMKDMLDRSRYFHNSIVNVSKRLKSSREQEIRDPPEPAIIKVPPTPEELESIKANVATVMMNGWIDASHEYSVATKVTAIIRGRQGRMQLSLHRKARMIQKVWRGFDPRRTTKAALRRLDLEKFSVTQIQSIFRMKMNRQVYLKYKAVRKVQHAWRGYDLRMKYLLHKKSNSAATKMQAIWRSFVCRSMYVLTIFDIVTIQGLARRYIARQNFLRELKATEIQRFFRGYKGRHVFLKLKRAYIRKCSAISIQRNWRGYVAKQQYWLVIGCAIEVQRVTRGMIARNNYLDKLGCFIVSQSVIRRWLSCRVLTRLRQANKYLSASVKIQAFVRGYHGRNLFLQHQQKVAAATKIQTAWRSFAAFSDYVFTLNDIVSIQRYIRAYLKRKRAVIAVQKVWRGYVCSINYVTMIMFVVTIQRFVRGNIGRKEYALEYEKRERQRAQQDLVRKSAVNIERVCRGFLDRVLVSKIRRRHQMEVAAIAIQSSWRSYFQQGIMWYKLDCVVIIQAHVRRHLEQMRYFDQLWNITVAQSAVRRWFALRIYKQKRLMAALSFYAMHQEALETRSAKTVQHFCQHAMSTLRYHNAAIKIQSFFRMVQALVEREIAIQMKRRKERKSRKKQPVQIVNVFLSNESSADIDRLASKEKTCTFVTSSKKDHLLSSRQIKNMPMTQLKKVESKAGQTSQNSFYRKQDVDAHPVFGTDLNSSVARRESHNTAWILSQLKVTESVETKTSTSNSSEIPSRGASGKIISRRSYQFAKGGDMCPTEAIQIRHKYDGSDDATEISALTVSTAFRKGISMPNKSLVPKKDRKPTTGKNIAIDNSYLDIDISQHTLLPKPSIYQGTTKSLPLILINKANSSSKSIRSSLLTQEPPTAQTLDGKMSQSFSGSASSTCSKLDNLLLTGGGKRKSRIEKGLNYILSRSNSRDPSIER
jgi:IQ calmodulin-binding motif